MGKKSRDKGARSERQLRDELLRNGWSDVIRVPLSGAVKTRAEYTDDVVGRPPGYGTEIRFENKARKTGFEQIYGLLPPSVDHVAFSTEDHELIILTLDPNVAITHMSYTPISKFDAKTQRVLNSVAKKCRDWIGTAQILSLKQDRMPFIYIRYRK